MLDEATPAMPASAARGTTPRALTHRSRGHVGGPITRLMSPGDLGQLVRPFVFLDLFDLDGARGPALDAGWHPHSGIATVTVPLEGAVRYAESTGATGRVDAGGVEWMRAGAGVWHTGTSEPGRTRGFQLWVALPPAMELAPAASLYVAAEQVPRVGPARVVLGSYGGVTSPIASPPMTYLAVHLAAGERWTFEPPPGHDVAWLAILDGSLTRLTRPDVLGAGEFVIFERSTQAIDLTAQAETRFVLGAAPAHPHDLVLGPYSVHTSREALARGDAEIRRLGAALRDRGKRSAALRTYA